MQSSAAPAAALLRSNNPQLQPRASSPISSADLTWLRSLLASREKDLAQYQYEVPEEFFPTEIQTPYGVVQDNHNVRESRGGDGPRAWSSHIHPQAVRC